MTPRTSSKNITSHLSDNFSIIPRRYACEMYSKYAGIKLVSAVWKILKICHHTLTSCTQLQNKSFHVVEKRRTVVKGIKMKITRAKRAKLYLFSVVKYANLWRSCPGRGGGGSCLNSLFYQAGTAATATTTPENNVLIGWMRKNNRSARAARTLIL